MNLSFNGLIFKKTNQELKNVQNRQYKSIVYIEQLEEFGKRKI
jgi:hypothetical protein